MNHSEQQSIHESRDGDAADGPQTACDLRVAFDGNRGRAISFTCDGREIRAYEGETVAALSLQIRCGARSRPHAPWALSPPRTTSALLRDWS